MHHSNSTSHEVRRSSTASSENSPTLINYATSSIERAKSKNPTTSFTKMKTYSSKGEWIIPEKRYFYEDLNVIFSEDPSKFLGHFDTDFYKITRKFIFSQKRKEMKLYYTRMEPIRKVKAQLCIIHGFGEHSGRFLTFADYFAKKGFIVHMLDLSGFGYSGGRGCYSSLEELHQDIEVLLGQAELDLPLFVMGQGLGAGILLSFLIMNPKIRISGVITTSALVKTHRLLSYNFASKWILESLVDEFGGICFNAKLNPTSLSKNNYHIKKYLTDPLIFPMITLKMLKTVSDILSFVMPNADKFEYPFIAIHGLKDIITNPQDSINFYKMAKSQDKSLKLFEEGFHQLHDDNELINLQKTIYDWCKPRIKHSKPFNGIKNQIFYGIPKKSSFFKRISFIISFIIMFLIKK